MNPAERRIVALLGPAVVRVLASVGPRRATRWVLAPGCPPALRGAVSERVSSLWPDDPGPVVGCVVAVVHGREKARVGLCADHAVRDAHDLVRVGGHVLLAGASARLLADPGSDVLWGRFVPHTVIVRGDSAVLWFTSGSRPRGYPAIVVLQ